MKQHGRVACSYLALDVACDDDAGSPHPEVPIKPSYQPQLTLLLATHGHNNSCLITIGKVHFEFTDTCIMLPHESQIQIF